VSESAPDSVHLCDYPVPDERLIDPELEREVELARTAVSLGRAAREKSKLKVRQPLSSCIVRLQDASEQAAYTRHADEIKEELNVRELLFTDAGAEFPEGFETAEQGETAVGVNTRLTRELENEGFAREIVHKVQNLRKEAGFEVTDRIRLHHESSPRLAEAVRDFKDYIGRETLAIAVTDEPVGNPDIAANVKINGEPARLALIRTKE